MAYPLEQGLKPDQMIVFTAIRGIVLMAYPLEQGLKLHYPTRARYLAASLNGLSTRTRIETAKALAGAQADMRS